MFAVMFAFMIGAQKADAVTHFVSGALAELGNMEEETSITPEFIESLFLEGEKLKYFGEAAQELESKLGPLKNMLNQVNATVGSMDFSPMKIVGELEDALKSPSPTTIENPTAMYSWLNNTLVPDIETATHEDLVENAKELATLRNGSRATQYAQAMRMYLDMDDRAKGLYDFTSYDASGDATTYQAFLSSYEARVYELNTDRLYMQSLGVLSANTDYMAGNDEVFRK